MSFEKLTNFRSLGGLKTKDGRTVKNNRLLRSGELSAITFADIAQLTSDYNLKEVIDMRTNNEITERPDITIPGTTMHHIDFFGKQATEKAPTFESMKDGETPDADQHLMHAYEDMLLGEVGQSAYRSFFDILLDTEDGAVLWHCFAGKDRTGTSAALILEALGVSREDIYEDYLKTNASRKSENDAMLRDLQAQGYDDETLEQIENMLYVKKEYLDFFFKTIDEKFGNTENFLFEALGLTPADIEKLKELYLD